MLKVTYKFRTPIIQIILCFVIGVTELILAIQGTKHGLIILHGFVGGWASMAGVAIIFNEWFNKR